MSASPGSTRSGSLGFAAAAVQAATAAAAGRESEDEEASSAGGRWVRVDSRRQRASSVGAGPSQVRPQHWSHRQGTPPPQSLSRYLEQQAGGSGHGSGGSASRAHWHGEEQRRRHGQHAQHSQRDMVTPPPPARLPSWRRSATRSPSPDRSVAAEGVLAFRCTAAGRPSRLRCRSCFVGHLGPSSSGPLAHLQRPLCPLCPSPAGGWA